MAQGERMVWCDGVKALFIIAIVLMHSHVLPIDAEVLFPTFFAVAGMLFRPGDDVWRWVKRRCRRILRPYVVLGIVLYCLWLVLAFVHRHRSGESMNLLTPLVECALGRPHTIMGAYWFALSLLAAQLLHCAMMRLLPSRWHLPLAVALAAGVYYIYFTDAWGVFMGIFFLPFHVLGYRCRAWFTTTHTRAAWQRLALAVLAVVLYVLMAHTHAHLPRRWHNLVFLAAQFVLVPAVIELAQWVPWRGIVARAATGVAGAALIYLAVQCDAVNYATIILTATTPLQGIALHAAVAIITLAVCHVAGKLWFSVFGSRFSVLGFRFSDVDR